MDSDGAWSTARHGSTARLAHYAEHIADDPNLRDVTTLDELHARLSSLSAALSASDPSSSVFKQLTFPTAAGEGHPSPVFVPNRFKKDMSTDGVRIGQHYRYAVKAEEHVVQALEYACDTVPSLILAADGGGGGGGDGGSTNTPRAPLSRTSLRCCPLQRPAPLITLITRWNPEPS